MGSYNVYIVKSFEEECGIEYFRVFVPENEEREKTLSNFHMAATYAQMCDFDDIGEGKCPQIWEYRQDNNRQDTFNYYLTAFCGYDVEPIIYDFEYEW